MPRVAVRHRHDHRTAIVGLIVVAAVGGRSPLLADEGAAVLPPPSLGGAAAPPATPSAESISSPAPSQGLEPSSMAAALSGEIVPTPMWFAPAYWFGPAPWDAGIELGINGSEGNNSVFSMRSGGHVKRVTDLWKFDSSLVYNKNVAKGVETQNNGKVDVRLDRILAESRWTVFSLDNLIYDEFQAFNIQLSLDGGLGYQLVKTPQADLLTRFGAGATREFGGPDDQWKPTGLFGVDYTHQITKSQKLTAKVDYYPEWADFGNYRVVSDLGWVIALDQPKNVSLKFSVIDRYDSTPDGKKPNSFDYAVLLIWAL